MDKRQTIIITLTVAAVFVLADQVYELVHHDVSHAAEVKTKMIAPPRHAQSSPTIPIYQPQLPPQVVANEQQLVTHQQKYIDLVNQYELAKMQRQLLEEEVAIAAARQRIAELNQKTQQLAGPTTLTDDLVAPTTKTDESKNFPSSNLSAYQLAYLDHQGDNYTATLVKNGQYQEVTSGLQLPDGSEIKQISTDGVLLQAGNQLFRLTFNGLETIKENPVAHQAIAANTPVVVAAAPIKVEVKKKPKTMTLVADKHPKIKISPKKKSAEKTKKSIKHPPSHSAEPQINDLSNLTSLQTNLFHPSRHLKVSTMPVVKTAAPMKPAPAKPNHSQTYTLDEILLLELPPTSYTIELKSSYDKKDLTSFANQNALGENAIYYSLPQQDKNRYVLLYSYFNTKAEAQAVLKNLPPAMLTAHPRITTLTDIQHWIKAEK